LPPSCAPDVQFGVRAVIRDEPFTVERDGVPVDVGAILRRSEIVHEWLSFDRWHVIVGDALTESERGVHHLVDVEGTHWRFRPIVDGDQPLLFPHLDPPPADFAAWVSERLRLVGKR
jgi:hypothetical protein